MENILLVTLQSINIGNRLQNYALQTVLENMGLTVYNPSYLFKNTMNWNEIIKYYAKYILGLMKVKKFRSIVMREKRKKVFSFFDDKYISNKFFIEFDEIYKYNWKNYDYAIVGSDQVWHRWSNDTYELPYFYLDFMPKDKRIAYAASFGFSKFDLMDKEIHRKGIDNMTFLSCREKRGQELIYELTGRSAEIVLDPTLLLSNVEWLKLAKKPNYEVEDRYLLVYFLGKTEQYASKIYEFAKSNGIQIINIFDTNEEKYYCTSPEEFIWLVENATVIFTDSFHACVFSILFHKIFRVFRRNENGFEDMFDRIESLLEKFNLQENIFNGCNLNLLDSTNWNEVEYRLKIQKQRSIDYLQNAMKNMLCKS